MSCEPVSEYGPAGEVGKIQEEFKKRGVKIIALSLNEVEAHKE